VTAVPSWSLAGKTALVTGAATGIGKAIARALAAAGANVAINHPHTPELAAAVVSDIAAAGGSAIAVAAYISNRAEFDAMVAQVLHEYHRCDVLVNNAAVAITKPFPEITEQEFDLSFAVNVNGLFHGLQLAWAHLADGGRITTISSSTTALMLPGYAVYDATKGAVEQLTHILAEEFGPRRITVNAVSPGATETENIPSRHERSVPSRPGGNERLRQARPTHRDRRCGHLPGQRRRRLGDRTKHPRQRRHRVIA
jgi:3-oxoacyl-[acyl-carrier protein] reductase